MSTASRTLLGPLTTTFTPPASCTIAWFGGVTSGTAQAWVAQDCHPVTDYVNEDDLACWPTPTSGAYTPSTSPRVWANGWGFYSPGLICPSGYSSACSATAAGTSDFSMQFPLTAGETAIGCCPSGYGCSYTADSQTCVATVTTGTLAIGSCSGSQDSIAFQGSIPDAYVVGESTETITAVLMSAPLFQLNFQASDLSTATSGSSGVNGATATVTVVSEPTQAATANSGSTSLSTGAQIGIGVSIGVVGLGAIGALIGCLLSRYRKKRLEQEADNEEIGASQPPPAWTQVPQKPPSELAWSPSPASQHGQQQKQPSELWTPASQPSELAVDGSREVHELPVTSPESFGHSYYSNQDSGRR
ncbi:hypothetical protein BX600DRAFT_507398 [Xylariales sp. PMI_506]|nr:hypothetical protein BX600DRAFT_507398 [Xylariales sp. PMI_506]